MTRFDHHRRRAHQHLLFALNSTCTRVRRSHERLAAVHWAVATSMRPQIMKRPA